MHTGWQSHLATYVQKNDISGHSSPLDCNVICLQVYVVLLLQTGFWDMDYAYMKAIEGPIVDGVGLGYPGFFALPGQVKTANAAPRANQIAAIIDAYNG